MALDLALMAAPLMKAQNLGITSLGARQALTGELITNPLDRTRVAEILAAALGDQNQAMSGWIKSIGKTMGGPI